VLNEAAAVEEKKWYLRKSTIMDETCLNTSKNSNNNINKNEITMKMSNI